MVKISVITWNGGFREFFHTVDFFKEQAWPADVYEFIWVEYYDSAAPELVQKINRMDNGKIVYVGGEGQWHAGRCMNAGIAASSGDLLVFVDGDVAVKSNFLTKIWEIHTGYDNLVLYVRRWDEPEEQRTDFLSLEHLEAVCQLKAPTNFGGCLTIRRKNIAKVGGYEGHPVFGGPGAISKELSIRLRNAGFPIMWHPTEKIYHPWHSGTLPSIDTSQQRQQSWVIKQRSLNLDVSSDPKQVETYLGVYAKGSGKQVGQSIETTQPQDKSKHPYPGKSTQQSIQAKPVDNSSLSRLGKLVSRFREARRS